MASDLSVMPMFARWDLRDQAIFLGSVAFWIAKE